MKGCVVYTVTTGKVFWWWDPQGAKMQTHLKGFPLKRERLGKWNLWDTWLKPKKFFFPWFECVSIRQLLQLWQDPEVAAKLGVIHVVPILQAMPNARIVNQSSREKSLWNQAMFSSIRSPAWSSNWTVHKAQGFKSAAVSTGGRTRTLGQTAQKHSP